MCSGSSAKKLRLAVVHAKAGMRICGSNPRGRPGSLVYPPSLASRVPGRQASTTDSSPGYGATIIVDVTPIDASVLGFSNPWYPAAIETAHLWRIAGHDVRIVTPALFIAENVRG